MKESGYLSISDFAKFSRTTRDTLLHYDKIGLLEPTLRAANNYRFYSSRQLALVNVIRTLQKLGMTLDEIQELRDRRTPAMIDDTLQSQIERIDAKIDEWNCARSLLLALRESIHSAIGVDEETVSVEALPEEAIVLGGLNDYSNGNDDYGALCDFYREINGKYPDLDLNRPVWGMLSADRVRSGDWTWPDRFYFYAPEGRDRRPAATYAIGYARGGYGQTEGVYRRIIEYMGENGLEICGDAFEEYPLNEISIISDDEYLIRVMIPVVRAGIS